MKKQCKAKSKQSGEQCKRTVTPGSQVCRMHGGKTPKGIASKNFKHGKRSKYLFLPEHISERVAEFINDPELLELRESIAVLDGRLVDLYDQLHKSEPAFVWKELQQLFERWQRLEVEILDAQNKLDSQSLINSIMLEANDLKIRFCHLLTNGASEELKAERIWGEILNVANSRRKLVESEAKRLKDSQQIISYEQFMGFCQIIVSIIKANVSDRETLEQITHDFGKHNFLFTRPTNAKN